MTSQPDLPFALTPESQATWLESLSALPVSAAAHQLNQALKQLKNTPASASELLTLLINLTPLTLHLANNLLATPVSENRTSDKSLKIAKLSLHLLRQLSLLFANLTKSPTMGAAAQAIAIYYGLQLMGQALRGFSCFYEAPSATLWKNAAELYSLAEEKHCLKQQQSSKLTEFKLQASIEAVIKRNLLFSLCNPNLYRREDIESLFQFANQHGDKLVINHPQTAEQFDYCWDLSSDHWPGPVKHINQLAENLLAIDSRPIGEALQDRAIVTGLSTSLQAKLALHLSGYQPLFKTIIPGLPSRIQMVLGFERICAYLQEQQKLARIMRLGGQAPQAGFEKSAMTLVPLAHQRNVFDAVEKPFSKALGQGRAVNILKTPNNAYAIVEGRAFDCSSGDLVLLYKEQQPGSLAIIRQQTLHDLSGSTHILLEKIQGDCSVDIFSIGTGHYPALLIDEHIDRPELFLASGKYPLDSVIRMSSGKVAHIKACLETNRFFARFKISLES